MKLCPMQELCKHYETGDNKPKNNDVRNKYPCKQWLDYSCEKIWALGELQEWCTGKPMACKIKGDKK